MNVPEKGQALAQSAGQASADPTARGLDRGIALTAGWLVLGIAFVALAGWFFDIEFLTTLWPGGAQLKPVEAFGLAACAISLLYSMGPWRERPWRLALSLAVSAFGLLFLIEYAWALHIGVGGAVWRDGMAHLPDRPSILASVSFVAIGFALALAPVTAPAAQFTRGALAVGGIALAGTGILGYFVSSIDADAHRTVYGFAINTAAAFFFLSAGVLAAGRGRQRSSEFVSLGAPILGLAALAGLIVVSLFAVEAQHRVRERAQSAEEIEKSLMRLLGQVRDAESGQRGYLLMGSETYLEPFRTAAPEVASTFETLRKEVGGDSEMQSRLERIRILATAKLDELERTISLKRAGNSSAALAIVGSGAGKRAMDDLRQAIGAMRDNLNGQVNRQRARANSELTRLQFSTLLSAALVSALAFFVFLDGRRRFDHLRRIQRELSHANANLDRRIREKTAALSAALNSARQAEGNIRELNAHLEEQVSERSRELDRIFRLSSDILGVGDFAGRLIRLSPAFETITGRSGADAVARPALDLIHPDDQLEAEDAFAKVFAGRALIDFVARCPRADGRACWLSWRIVSVAQEHLFYFVIRDITEERHRDELARQAQKMEAVGRLTGGIAHDFNNLLTIVIGNLDSLGRGLGDAAPRVRRQIEHALAGAQKAAALTGRLLAFSRSQPLAPTTVEANGLVAGMSEILHRTLGETVSVETVLAAGLWRTQVDPNQLENAILNLAINARDAMPDGGMLTIETANAHLDDSYVAANPEATAGQYVLIAVTDTGEGMSPEVKHKVFEPFFTTKPVGVGTGLGLSQVYGFIKQSGGHVAIYSEVGVGTTVKLYLPRTLSVLDREAGHRSPAVAHGGRGECILVVEDEDGVRSFVVETLEDAGYKVFAAADGATALAELNARREIDLLVTDVVLGGSVNGRELHDEALKHRLGLPVLFMTGYTRNAIIHNGRLDEGVHLLTKPFTAGVLLRKVRQMLDARDDVQLKLI